MEAYYRLKPKLDGKNINMVSESESEYYLSLRGEIVFVPDAPCKVETEIQHEWKQEIKIRI